MQLSNSRGLNKPYFFIKVLLHTANILNVKKHFLLLNIRSKRQYKYSKKKYYKWNANVIIFSVKVIIVVKDIKFRALKNDESTQSIFSRL